MAGIPLAWAAGNGVASFLYGVSANTVDTYVIVAGATSAAALLSSTWPAWRACRPRPSNSSGSTPLVTDAVTARR